MNVDCKTEETRSDWWQSGRGAILTQPTKWSESDWWQLSCARALGVQSWCTGKNGKRCEQTGLGAISTTGCTACYYDCYRRQRRGLFQDWPIILYAALQLSLQWFRWFRTFCCFTCVRIHVLWIELQKKTLVNVFAHDWKTKCGGLSSFFKRF